MKNSMRYLLGVFALVLITNFASAQSEFAPVAGSTFTYKVDVDDNNNNVTWAIKKDGTALTAGVDFSNAATDYIITTETATTGEVGFAKATITWGPNLGEGTYVLEFTEIGGSCTTVRTADVILTANTSFDLTAAATETSACNSLNNTASILDQDATTEIQFTVDMEKAASWSIESWKYKFALTPTYADASMPAPSITSVTIDGNPKNATDGKYEDATIPEGTTQRTITVKITGNANKTINVAFAVSEAFAVNGITDTAEGGSDTNNATTSITKLPGSSAIIAN